ncbi:MAG: hypothetical protein ACJ0HN_05020 [Alphaproteobacteria bacterium]
MRARETATTLAALKKLLAEGSVDGSEKTVSMIAGAGVKPADNIQPVSLPTISANEVLES